MKDAPVNWKTYGRVAAIDDNDAPLYHNNPRAEVNTRPSKTVPGQAPPIADLIQRYVRGEPVTQFPGNFSDDDTFTDLGYDRMDEQDRLMEARRLKAVQEETRSRLSQRSLDRQAKAQAALDKMNERKKLPTSDTEPAKPTDA